MTDLPPHLKKLIDTPEKRARADKIVANMAYKEEAKMKKKGYTRIGNLYFKTK